MDKTVTMSTKELSRLEVMQRLKDKRLIQKEVANLLGLSTREIKRVWQKYQKQDAKGLISKRRGTPSNNRQATIVLMRMSAKPLCDYNDETLAPNSLVSRAQEKRYVSRISRQAR